jgi:hypothetical protein
LKERPTSFSSNPILNLANLVEALVPHATYSLRVHKAEYVATPKSPTANPYIHVWHVITAAPDPQFVGRMVFMNYPIKGDGSYRCVSG